MKISNEVILKIWNMVFNMASQMLQNEDDARDATQSIFEIVLDKSESFRHESKLSTWIYRISYNYLVDELRYKKKEMITFDLFERDVAHFKECENELNLSREEESIYIGEIKIGCTKAMLQCLNPGDRFIFILGTIFCFPQKEAALICNLSYSAYRMRLSRSKKKIKSFMSKNCGLVNQEAKCKCNKRLLIAKERGRINLEKSLYRTNNKKIIEYISEMNEMDEIAIIYRNNPFLEMTNDDISRKIQDLEIVQEMSDEVI